MIKFRNPYSVSAGQRFKDQSQCVPGQAYDIRELVDRFTRGERLLVNNRPANLFECDDDGNLKNGESDETLDNVLPRMDDMVDMELYLESLKEHSNYLQGRIRKATEKRNQLKDDSKEEDK